MNNLTAVVGRCPAYALRNAKWYCSSAVYGAVLLALQAAAGGNTINTIVEGTGQLKCLGFPVELTEVMPTVDTTVSTQILHFGDLSLASDFGDRRQTTIKFSDSAVVCGVSTFERDETAVVGTMRFDINNHDLGTSTVAGPIVSLITAAS